MNPHRFVSMLDSLCSTTWIVGSSKSIRLRVASVTDRQAIVDVINSVAGERKYLQTSQYCPTPLWERLLAEGVHMEDGLLLLVVESLGQIVGFARLYPDESHAGGRQAGNIGIALLRSYRSIGIGAIILKGLIACATELDYQVLTANILETNIRSRRLFARCGFRKVNRRSVFLVFINDHANELYCEMQVPRLREVSHHERSDQQEHDRSEAAATGNFRSFPRIGE